MFSLYGIVLANDWAKSAYEGNSRIRAWRNW